MGTPLPPRLSPGGFRVSWVLPQSLNILVTNDGLSHALTFTSYTCLCVFQPLILKFSLRVPTKLRNIILLNELYIWHSSGFMGCVQVEGFPRALLSTLHSLWWSQVRAGPVCHCPLSSRLSASHLIPDIFLSPDPILHSAIVLLSVLLAATGSQTIHFPWRMALRRWAVSWRMRSVGVWLMLSS